MHRRAGPAALVGPSDTACGGCGHITQRMLECEDYPQTVIHMFWFSLFFSLLGHQVSDSLGQSRNQEGFNGKEFQRNLLLLTGVKLDVSYAY